ncbi:acetyl-coenzyme A transporter 1-domain-containing protein [Apiospora arundinis]
MPPPVTDFALSVGLNYQTISWRRPSLGTPYKTLREATRGPGGHSEGAVGWLLSHWRPFANRAVVREYGTSGTLQRFAPVAFEK